MFELAVAILSVTLIAISQLLFKSAAADTARSGARAYLTHPKILGGLALNGLAAVAWIIALRRLEISYLYPILSINYLVVPLAARRFFHETISRRRLIAISIIGIGVFVSMLGA